MDDDKFIKVHPVLFKKYKIKKKIGQGAFGAVYLGHSIKDNQKVAIKTEKRQIAKPLLESEAFLLANIKGIGIPNVVSFGKTKYFTVLIEPLLGKTLFDIFIQKGKLFPLEELCLISLQVIDRLETIHAQSIIHRDIKPDNFLIGKEDPNVIYLVDFGLSKKYRSSKGHHIKFTNTGRLTGTLRFASPNALRGGEQSRKDDLISAGYMIIYLMRKKLPWQLVRADNSTDKYIKIYRMKKTIKPENLCQDLPKEMAEYMRYVQHLGFESNPDYNYLRKLFHSILKELNLDADKLIFSWIKPSDIQKLKKPKNPHSRKSSPQSRILNKIKENLQEKKRGVSSSDTSENNSYEGIPVVANNPNMKIQRNYSKENLDPSDITNIKSKNNTLMVNFDKTINNKLLVGFENIDNQLESNDTTDNPKKGLLSPKCKPMINNLINYENSDNNVFPFLGKHNKINNAALPQQHIKTEEQLDLGEKIERIKKEKELFYGKNKVQSGEIEKNNEINNLMNKKNSGEQFQEINSINKKNEQNIGQINMGIINDNNINGLKSLEKKTEKNKLKKVEEPNKIFSNNINNNMNNINNNMNNINNFNNINSNANLNLILNKQSGNKLPKKSQNPNLIMDNNNQINFKNMKTSKTPKIKNSKILNRINHAQIPQNKLKSGNDNKNKNLVNKNINNINYFPSNTNNNEPKDDFIFKKMINQRNMPYDDLNNPNALKNNFITYTEPSDTYFDDRKKVHKNQTEQLNNKNNMNAFKIFKENNNDLYDNNDSDFNPYSNNNNIKYNMNQNNIQNMMGNNINNINKINMMKQQMQMKKKSQKKQNNKNIERRNKNVEKETNFTYNNMNVNKDLNLNMNVNNNLMQYKYNPQMNNNNNNINNNLINQYNHHGMKQKKNIMTNNYNNNLNYYPNNNIMQNNNINIMQNYNIQNYNNYPGQMSDFRNRYEMNNPNKNIRPMRFDMQNEF